MFVFPLITLVLAVPDPVVWHTDFLKASLLAKEQKKDLVVHFRADDALDKHFDAPDVREQLQAPKEIHGAVVEQVAPGSSAEDAGLQRGDVIEQVNRHDVQSASDVQQALSKVEKGQDALVLVWSNGGNTFRVLHAPAGS